MGTGVAAKVPKACRRLWQDSPFLLMPAFASAASTRLFSGSGSATQFPSPQGGSETAYLSRSEGGKKHVSIPSRRVGDFTARVAKDHRVSVSVPSRRVGDLTEVPHTSYGKVGFHPLKAGRRRILLSAEGGGGDDSEVAQARQILKAVFMELAKALLPNGWETMPMRDLQRRCAPLFQLVHKDPTLKALAVKARYINP